MLAKNKTSETFIFRKVEFIPGEWVAFDESKMPESKQVMIRERCEMRDGPVKDTPPADTFHQTVAENLGVADPPSGEAEGGYDEPIPIKRPYRVAKKK